MTRCPSEGCEKGKSGANPALSRNCELVDWSNSKLVGWLDGQNQAAGPLADK